MFSASIFNWISLDWFADGGGWGELYPWSRNYSFRDHQDVGRMSAVGF